MIMTAFTSSSPLARWLTHRSAPRKHWLIGAVVIEFRSPVDAPSAPSLRRVGEVIAVKRPSDIWLSTQSDEYRYAVCRVFDDSGDSSAELFYPCIDDPAFKISPHNPRVYYWRT